jgi:hypothetical protein
VLFLPKDLEGKEMTTVLLGVCDAEDEACISLLKTAVLIKMVKDEYGNDCHVTWKHIVACIRKCDDESNEVIMNSSLVKHKRTAVSKKQFDSFSSGRTCEHASLSLSNWGELYMSTHIPNNTKMLNIRDRKDVLHAICLHFDFTGVKPPTTNGVTRRVWENLTSQEHITQGEEWMATGFQKYISANTTTLNETQHVPPPPPGPPPAADQW